LSFSIEHKDEIQEDVIDLAISEEQVQVLLEEVPPDEEAPLPDGEHEDIPLPFFPLQPLPLQPLPRQPPPQMYHPFFALQPPPAQENLKRDAHWKVAKDLCSNYDHIICPTFQTLQMVERATRRILSVTVREMMHWGHFDYRQRLKQTALKMGVQVHVRVMRTPARRVVRVVVCTTIWEGIPSSHALIAVITAHVIHMEHATSW